MCDGHRTMSGLSLCTDSYTLQEVVLLINILILKYNFICSIHKSKKGYRIYISTKSLPSLISIVEPYMLSSFKYKLSGLSKNKYINLIC